MQAVLILCEVVPQLPEQHGAVDLRVCREGGGLDLFEALHEPTLIFIAFLECLKTHVCPLIIPRAIAVLESSLRVLGQRPLPVVINNGGQLCLSRRGGAGLTKKGGSGHNTGREEQRGASTGRMAHSSPPVGQVVSWANVRPYKGRTFSQGFMGTIG